MWISDKCNFICGHRPHAKSCLTEICVFFYLFPTLNCKTSKPIGSNKRLYFIILAKNIFLSKFNDLNQKRADPYNSGTCLIRYITLHHLPSKTYHRITLPALSVLDYFNNILINLPFFFLKR